MSEQLPPLPWERTQATDPFAEPVAPKPEPLPPVIGGPTPEELSVERPAVAPDIVIDTAPAVEAATAAMQAVVTSQMTGVPVEIHTTSEGGNKIRLTDAKNRAVRTLLQNLLIDIIVAVMAVLPHFIGLDFSESASWTLVGLSVTKTVLATIVSYISRLSVTPVIPTPMDTSIGVVQPLPNAKG